MTDMIVMTLFTFKIALVVHIAGALLLFAAVGLEAAITFLFRFAKTTQQIKVGLKIAKNLPAIFGISSVLVVLSGLYLGYLNWNHQEEIGWIIVALVFFVVISVAGSISGKGLTLSITNALASSEDKMTRELKATTHSLQAVAQLCVGACSILGILIIMIFQPSVVLTIVVFFIAVIIGLLIALTIHGSALVNS